MVPISITEQDFLHLTLLNSICSLLKLIGFFFLFDIHISNLNKLADFLRRNKTILIEIDYL